MRGVGREPVQGLVLSTALVRPVPRSNRPRGRRAPDEPEELDIGRVFAGRARTETRRGLLWNVQPVSGSPEKTYVCPGCHLVVPEGTAHVVAWRADGLMGEADDLAQRRHWHTHCWSIS